MLDCVAILCAMAAAGGVGAAEPAAAPAVAPAVVPSGIAAGLGAGSVRVELTNGDQFHGVILEDADPLVIEHALVGRMKVPRATIKSITPVGVPASIPVLAPESASPAPAQPTPPPAEPSKVPEVPIVVDVAPVAPPAAAPPTAPAAPAVAAEPTWLDNWKFTLEGGWNGSSGDNNQQSFRIRLAGVRPAADNTTSASVAWNHQQVDGDARASNVVVDMRNDWNSGPTGTGGGSWGFYVAMNSEFNEFTAWDYRISGNAGLSFDLLKNDDLTLVLRTGLGGTREFGSLNNDPRLEVWPSLDASLKIDDRSKLGAALTGAVNVEDVDGSRANMKAWYEVLLDPEHNLSLKLGIENKYEYAPVLGRENNQLEYYAALVISF
ncbi:MAG: DUF481 domain-containing protein [Phycisphaerales bacterium]|nr:DUF481 domain-containing protein [Phycisphaerales bacterium]